MAVFEPVIEAAYLTAQNASQYRRILRIFFYEYEKMHFQLYKEDVLELLHKEVAYESYPLEQLKGELEQLVAWRNLIAVQDPKKVYTIADYQNKQYSYSMSEAAVEIERLTVRLENLFWEKSSLSTNLFVKIYQALEQIPSLANAADQVINDWWHSLQADFKRLNQNYQDYLREFYAGSGMKFMKSLEFIQHKDLFITYLRDFISELKHHEIQISRSLQRVRQLVEERMLERIVQSELSVPSPNAELNQELEQRIRENVYGRWQSLNAWFIAADGESCECERVMEITNEIIRNIIKNAAMLIQLQNWGMSRRKDYHKFIELFQRCADLKEAHRLAAHLFGIQQICHYRVNCERETDSINSSPYEEQPALYKVRPFVRTYKPRMDKTGFVSHQSEKLAARQLYFQQAELARQMVLKYVVDNRLSIDAIEDCVSEPVRQILLRWIALANTNTAHKGQTEYGQAFCLQRQAGTCVLRCQDGDLVMPAYVFVFEEDAAHV